MLFGKHVNKYYLKYGFFFLLGLLSLVVVDYVQLEIPNIIGNIIDGLELQTLEKNQVVEYVKDIAIFGLIIVGGRFLWRIFIFGSSWRIDYELRNKMFAHAEKLSQTYYSEKKSGGLMALFINDLNAIRMAFGPALLMLFDILILGSLAFYRMYTLDKTITYFAAIPLAIIAIMATYISKITGKKFKARQQAFEDMSDFTQENFYGISVIKAFVNEIREIRAFAKINKRNQEKNVSYIKASTFLHIAVEMFINIIRVLMLGLGAWLVYKSVDQTANFSVGDLTRYIAYFGTLIWPMMAIGRLINIRAQSKASLDRVSAFLDADIEIHDDREVVDVKEIQGKVTFNNLTFKYPKTEKEVLKNINFVIEKGQTVSIVGRTGSGKTTLVDLMLRLYNLKTCELLIDDYDIMKLPIKTIRDAIGYVPQENFIFSDVIRNNISFASDEADQELIKQMAIYSDIHDNIVDFPNQYDTMVGERGVTLSGGQKQRISIARALLKNPQILIMDDSFSAVDTKTEEQVISNLRELRKGKTTIIIAHRISTIKTADKIIFIDNGEVKAQGTHDELLKSCEMYRNIVIHQRLEAELEVEVK